MSRMKDILKDVRGQVRKAINGPGRTFEQQNTVVNGGDVVDGQTIGSDFAERVNNKYVEIARELI